MPDTPQRPVRRRAHTRQRLLDAAYEVFVARGFGRVTVEDVCDVAGFTRGAFYSNFGSLDELFLVLYQQRATALVERINTVVGRPTRSADDTRVRELVDNVLDVLGEDERWFALNTEFTVYAVRHPELATALADHRRAVRDALLPALIAATADRNLPAASRTPHLLARSVVAIFDGTAFQIAVEPTDSELREWRRDLLLLAVGVPAGGRSTTMG